MKDLGAIELKLLELQLYNHNVLTDFSHWDWGNLFYEILSQSYRN